MNTLFDIGDEIEICIKGTVERYENSKFGDKYTIGLMTSLQRPESGNPVVRICLSTDNLLDLHASKIPEPVEGEK